LEGFTSCCRRTLIPLSDKQNILLDQRQRTALPRWQGGAFCSADDTTSSAPRIGHKPNNLFTEFSPRVHPIVIVHLATLRFRTEMYSACVFHLDRALSPVAPFQCSSCASLSRNYHLSLALIGFFVINSLITTLAVCSFPLVLTFLSTRFIVLIVLFSCYFPSQTVGIAPTL
jgi:hypothetical protein